MVLRNCLELKISQHLGNEGVGSTDQAWLLSTGVGRNLSCVFEFCDRTFYV
ncbi:hypothetical protein [Scytonema sp. UIC 10036]|uniref:hypothetical protein n=1 Tax=Scytonema sp. UIC 10036 TaxID=2304196 RepID=UPI00140FF663|nr:hypothetical protein [Scytonema sp. UIC 10036]